MNRRSFLASAVAAPSAIAALAAEPKLNRTPVVDTHTHCFAGKADLRFPYHLRGTYQPEQPTSPEFLLKLMDGAGDGLEEAEQLRGAFALGAIALRCRLLIESAAVDEAVGPVGIGELAEDSR